MKMWGEVIRDMDRGRYDALKRDNWSLLSEMLKSPAHLRYALDHKEEEDSDALRLGTASHCCILEPERWGMEYVVWRGGRRAGKTWESFQTDYPGRVIITEEEESVCKGMRDAVRAHKEAGRLLTGGAAETTVLWNIEAPPIGGLPGFKFEMKGRPDYVTPHAIVDLKTTRDASVSGFGRAAANFKYITQAAYYVDGYQAATRKRLPYFIVAVEKTPPFVVTVFSVPDEYLEKGRDEYLTLLSRLDACRQTNQWPGYAEGVVPLELPRWALNQYAVEEVASNDH